MRQYPLTVSLRSLIPLGNLVAEVVLADESRQLVRLENGDYQGVFPAQPVWLKLTARPAEQGVTGTPLTNPPEPTAVQGIEELYEGNGAAIPASGTLALKLVWGLHCHQVITLTRPEDLNAALQSEEKTRDSVRFGTHEHIACAEFVGRDDNGETLVVNGDEAGFDAETRFEFSGQSLLFGEITALAGDYYAHLDADAARHFNWAWPVPSEGIEFLAGDYRTPTLADDDPEVAQHILTAVYEAKDQDTLDDKSNMVRLGVLTRYPLKRYLALASQNFCHFANQFADGTVDDANNTALQLYRAYHARALKEAAAAGAAGNRKGLHLALVTDAFGCHFLTDLFATGHMRTPRAILSQRYGVIKGALGASHDMHCEDNNSGLWLTFRPQPGQATPAQGPRTVWKGFGDNHLKSREAEAHFRLVRRAVARSAAEVFKRFHGQKVALGDQAEALIPLALAAGQGPRSGDILPNGDPAPVGQRNGYPLYVWLASSKIVARRVGKVDQNLYVNHDKPDEDVFIRF